MVRADGISPPPNTLLTTSHHFSPLLTKQNSCSKLSNKLSPTFPDSSPKWLRISPHDRSTALSNCCGRAKRAWLKRAKRRFVASTVEKPGSYETELLLRLNGILRLN